VTADSGLWKLIRPAGLVEPERTLRAALFDDDMPDDAVPDYAVPEDAVPEPATAEAPLTASTPLPGPDGWTDALSGANGPLYWERVVANEDARRLRYGRTATVALVELVGFDDERSFLSAELLRTLFTRVARVIVREVRASDHVARIAPARFGILLVETDEVSAINFVDRLRQKLLAELGADPYFTARIGWASPDQGTSLDDALATASERLAKDPFAPGI
jgi:GGDEF domain-containing protein